jgi:hypothetical protein
LRKITARVDHRLPFAAPEFIQIPVAVAMDHFHIGHIVSGMLAPVKKHDLLASFENRIDEVPA